MAACLAPRRRALPGCLGAFRAVCAFCVAALARLCYIGCGTHIESVALCACLQLPTALVALAVDPELQSCREELEAAGRPLV